MKSVILLSVAMVLFNSGTLPANAAAYRQHKNHHSNLEAIISMAEQYTHNLTEIQHRVACPEMANCSLGGRYQERS